MNCTSYRPNSVCPKRLGKQIENPVKGLLIKTAIKKFSKK